MKELEDDEKEIKLIKPWLFDPCWRCNDAGPHWDSSATLTLVCSDASYSGIFRVPLCFSCACIPHNQFPNHYRMNDDEDD